MSVPVWSVLLQPSSRIKSNRVYKDVFRYLFKSSSILSGSYNQFIAILRSCSYGLVSIRTFSQAVPDASQTLSPAVRYLVGTHNIADPSIIQSSGPKNRLLKGDVLKYLNDVSLSSVTESKSVDRSHRVLPSVMTPEPSHTDLQVKEEAKTMVRSKNEIPHVYFTAECRLPSWFQNESEVIQAYMIKSTALAMERLPEANGIWLEDKFQFRSDIVISYSLLRDGFLKHGVINSPNKMSLKEISHSIEDNMNTHGDHQRGSISIHQALGSDVTEQTSVLSPGETMSLYISSKQRTITLTLTADARVLDSELAARWLGTLRDIVGSGIL